MARGIQKLALAAGLALLPLSTATAAPIADTGLGFGKFLGTWEHPPFDNPTSSGNNTATIGQYILDEHPGLFDIDEFHFAGSIDSYNASGGTNSNPEGQGFRVLPESASTAKWTYDGFPFDPRGDDPVDLFIAVKYGDFFSVFQYEIVNPGSFGYLTSDWRVILENTPDAEEAGLMYGGFTAPCPAFVDGFSATCIPLAGQGGIDADARDISHVTAYWPPADQVPEPAILGLLGIGLLAAAAAGRRR